MEHAAGSPEAGRRSRLRALGADIGPKLFITLVAAGVTALLIPWITGKWQDHKQQLELRTSLASDMSRAYTSVIVTGRFVTGGLIYSGSSSKVENTAATQTAWTAAVHDWLVDSGTIEAELTGRYGPDGIAAEWRYFANAVTRYMRLGSQVARADRTLLLREEKAYVGRAPFAWSPLTRTKSFKNDPAWLLGRGDGLVQEELGLSPKV